MFRNNTTAQREAGLRNWSHARLARTHEADHCTAALIATVRNGSQSFAELAREIASRRAAAESLFCREGHRLARRRAATPRSTQGHDAAGCVSYDPATPGAS